MIPADLPADLTTGHRDIDRQHAVLFQLADRVRTQGAAGDRQATLDLMKYVIEHFGYEYRLMCDLAYPELEDHHAQHQALSAQVAILAERAFAGQDTHTELAELIDRWLRQHIQTTDRQLTAFIAALPE